MATPTRRPSLPAPNAPKKRTAITPRSGPLIRSRRLDFGSPLPLPIELGVSPDEPLQAPPYPPMDEDPFIDYMNRRIDQLIGFLHERAPDVPRQPPRSAGSA